MKFWFTIASLFLWNFYGCSQNVKWNTADTISNHEQAINQLNKIKTNSKKWTKQNQLDFSKRKSYRYVYISRFDSALVHVNTSIGLAKEFRQDSVLASMYKLKGTVFYYLTEQKKALDNWNNAEKIAEKNNYEVMKAELFSNYGAVYIEKDDFETSEKYLLKAIQINNNLNDNNSRRNLMSLRLLATNYSEQKKFDKSIPIYEELVKNCRIVNDSVVLKSALIFYAIDLSETHRKKEAYTIMDEALKIQRKTSDKQGLIANLMFYAKILKQNGNYPDALQKTNEAYELKEELFQEQMAKTASDAEIKYKTDSIHQQKKIIELQNNQDRQALIISEKKRNEVWLLVFFITIFAVTLFLIYFIYQQKQKTRSEKAKARELMNAVLEGEEKEKVRIAKELHDGVVQDLTAFKMEFNILDEYPSKQKTDMLTNEITKITNEIRELSYTMMPVTLKELGLIQALNELLNKNFVRNNITIEFDSFGISERLSEKIETTIYRICQELVNNTIKHSKAKSVSVLLQVRNNILQLTYEDDGVGFDIGKIKRGIGLNSLNSRVQMMNGTLEFEHSKTLGMTVFIRIPV